MVFFNPSVKFTVRGKGEQARAGGESGLRAGDEYTVTTRGQKAHLALGAHYIFCNTRRFF